MLEFLIEQNPNHVLLPQLQKGHSTINEVYLRHALNKIQPVKQVPPVDDVDLQKLYQIKSSLFGKRAKLSNRFHDCTTDAQRADLSDEIQVVQRQIERNMKAIKYYEEHGELPPQDQRFPIPKDPFAIVRKRNSLRSSISRLRKEIDTIGGYPADHPDRKKLPKLEADLNEKKLYLAHVERAIETESIQ